MVELLNGLALTIAGAFLALYLNWVVQRRAAARRRHEYHRTDLGGWQAWQRGFYDIRDWAGMVGSHLRNPGLREIDFCFIRIPGPRYLDFLIRTERIPAEYLQQAVILSDYCALLSDVLARVVAGQWLVRDADGGGRSSGGGPRHDDRELALQLAEAVEDMARELADPAGACREQRRSIAAAFSGPRSPA